MYPVFKENSNYPDCLLAVPVNPNKWSSTVQRLHSPPIKKGMWEQASSASVSTQLPLLDYGVHIFNYATCFDLNEAIFRRLYLKKALCVF